MELLTAAVGPAMAAMLAAGILAAGCSLLSINNTSTEAALFIDETPVTKEMVRAEFLHAWNGYKRYAWGHDALRPLSRGHRDWYKAPLLMTPVDAYDTMLIMGLDREAAEAKALIFDSLSFDHDMEVQHFEVSIRVLGGLISAYQMDGDERFLALARDLADRMLPVFDSPTGMPYRIVNLKTGKTSGRFSNPAEIGTYLLEYGTLSRLTGNPIYHEKAERAAIELYKRSSDIGLVGSMIDVETGLWIGRDASIGGGTDSYYEYLLKSAILFEDDKFMDMWERSIGGVNAHLADETGEGLWYGRGGMKSGRRTLTTFGALEAFLPGLLALGGDLGRAAALEKSCYRMWVLHGIEPEIMNYKSMKVVYGPYHLRPEIIESAYYLYHYTGDEEYRRMGSVFFNGLVRHCKTEAGYAALADVRSKNQLDEMESFFLAETMKYFYLLFAPPGEFDFDKVVFNTEAHPMFKPTDLSVNPE